MTVTTTFRTALPYAFGTLATGIAGAVLAVTATSTVQAVAGVAMGLFGSYAFFGVVHCGVQNSGRPEGFKREVWQYVATSAGAAVTDIIATVVRTVLINLLDNWLNGRRSRDQ